MTIEEIYFLFLKSSGLTTDTRKIETGNLFLALKGERFDGNEFAELALEKGATHAIVSDHNLAMHPRCILVNNTLKTLQQLATHHRRQFDIPLLAITGSNGKTTTKELLSSVLAQSFNCHYTKGNFNNHIGVPLTLLEMSKQTEIAVIEMGANHQGEIGELCQIAEPTYGLITNIGKAHLEGFGGIEGVKKGKGELYDYLSTHDGVAFVNKDEQFLLELATNVKRKIIYSKGNAEAGKVFQEAISPFVSVKFVDDQDRLVTTNSQLFGNHNFQNIMTAIAVGQYFKVPSSKIKVAIEAYRPKNNRSQLITMGNNQIILDAYNANPTSMRLALNHFLKFDKPKKVAILGSMLELGPYSSVEHDEIAEMARSLAIDQVILVGAEFANAAKRIGFPHFEDLDAIRPWWEEQNFENTAILIKGSRGIGLERLL